MSLQPCNSCYESPFLTEEYGNVMGNLDIYLADPEDMPKNPKHPEKVTLGTLYPYHRRVHLRNDLKGRYILGELGDCLVPIPAEDFVPAHEFEHALDLKEEDESVISGRVVERYVNYTKKKLDPFLRDVSARFQRYVNSLINKN